jgi:hypothetical protein
MATTSKRRGHFDGALAKEVMRGANKGFVFSLGDAQFGKRELAFHREASANFDERVSPSKPMRSNSPLACSGI